MLINKDASRLFHKEYHHDKNFLTPNLIALDFCPQNDSLIYELTWGTMFYPSNKAVGVTVVEVSGVDTVSRRRDLSKCFPDVTLQAGTNAAWEYINELT